MERTVDVIKHAEAPVPDFLVRVIRDARCSPRVIDRKGGDPLPGDGARGDATIVLGGPMGAYEEEEYPFLREERHYLRRLTGEGEPVLGICLGAQLVAGALGADVYPGDGVEVGWHELRVTEAGEDDPLTAPFARSSRVMQWHGDTFDLPDGARHLAASPTFESQAFRYGDRTWAVQFHPEIERRTVEGWVRFYEEHPELDRDPEDVEELMRTTDELLGDYQARSRRLFRAFLETVGGSGPAGSAASEHGGEERDGN